MSHWWFMKGWEVKAKAWINCWVGAGWIWWRGRLRTIGKRIRPLPPITPMHPLAQSNWFPSLSSPFNEAVQQIEVRRAPTSNPPFPTSQPVLHAERGLGVGFGYSFTSTVRSGCTGHVRGHSFVMVTIGVDYRAHKRNTWNHPGACTHTSTQTYPNSPLLPCLQGVRVLFATLRLH